MRLTGFNSGVSAACELLGVKIAEDSLLHATGRAVRDTLIGPQGMADHYKQQLAHGDLFNKDHGVLYPQITTKSPMVAPGQPLPPRSDWKFSKLTTALNYAPLALNAYFSATAPSEYRGSAVGGALGGHVGQILGSPFGVLGSTAGSLIGTVGGRAVGHIFDRSPKHVPTPDELRPPVPDEPGVDHGKAPISSMLSDVSGRPA